MKRLLASIVLIAATSALAGCYYDPGYSYVRSSSVGGDAYYGQGGTVYESAPGYYGGYGGYYPGYYPSYYGGYYGCCYTPGVTIGVSRTWYGGRHYRGGRDYHRRGHHGSRDHGYRGNGKATRPRSDSRSRPRVSPPRQETSPNRDSRRNHPLRSRGPSRQ